MRRSFLERRRGQRTSELLAQARRKRFAGHVDEALRDQLDAVRLIRVEMAARPDDPLPRRAAASALYTLGALQTETGQLHAAVAALDESEELYAALGRTDALAATRLLADVRLRRGFALMLQGRGASALSDVDAALAAHTGLPAGETSAEDLSRVLAMGSLVLSRFGDPDLARAAADTALRSYLSQLPPSGSFSVPAEHAPYLRHAATVAAALHVRHGRPDLGLVAAILAVQLGGEYDGQHGPALSRLRALAERRGRLTPEDPAALDDEFTGVLRQVTRADPRPGSALDRLGDTTLAGALAAVGGAEAAELAAALTRPALACEILFPARRCPATLAPAYARRLGGLALDVLPSAPVEGLRLAVEAHCLFVAASRAGGVAELSGYGPVWARTLLAASATFEAHGDLPMAVDLASWADGVAQQLMPYAFADNELAVLLHDCVAHHGRLLVAHGDRETGERSLTAARALAELTGRR